jgi:hypothetical protein
MDVEGDERPEVDPEDFLHALLKVSPEDAAKVREQAGTSADPHEGPKATARPNTAARHHNRY